MGDDRDRAISSLLIRVFAAAIRDLENVLQELPDPWRSQCLPLEDYIWQRVEEHLSAPLESLPETPETARSQNLVYVIANSLDEYLKLTKSDGT